MFLPPVFRATANMRIRIMLLWVVWWLSNLTCLVYYTKTTNCHSFDLLILNAHERSLNLNIPWAPEQTQCQSAFWNSLGIRFVVTIYCNSSQNIARNTIGIVASPHNDCVLHTAVQTYLWNGYKAPIPFEMDPTKTHCWNPRPYATL